MISINVKMTKLFDVKIVKITLTFITLILKKYVIS